MEAARASRWKRSIVRRVVGHVVGKEFQRHAAAQARVFRLVDHAHPTAAEFVDDRVVGNGAADHGVGFRHERSILRCRPYSGKSGRQRTTASCGIDV